MRQWSWGRIPTIVSPIRRQISSIATVRLKRAPSISMLSRCCAQDRGPETGAAGAGIPDVWALACSSGRSSSMTSSMTSTTWGSNCLPDWDRNSARI